MTSEIELAPILLKILPVLVVLLHIAPVMAWVERRGSALMQNRLGPNRIGPFGLLQSICEAIKFVSKEDPIPAHTMPFYYAIAPILCLVPAFTTIAVVPFADHWVHNGITTTFQIADLNVGLLYILSLSSLGVYGIIIAGWASNNKYALLGSLRSSAQMISYELSLGLAIIGVVMISGTTQLNDIARMQGEILFSLGPISIPKWGVLVQPLGFIICLTAIFAETNRLPFDLPEGESEIIAGYHLEYGSMKFATFMMAEYTNMFVGSALLATLYFGGWQMLPGMATVHAHLVELAQFQADGAEILRVIFQILSIALKVAFSMWFFVWVRWTIPRFRYDQLMDLGWKVMLPLSLVNIFVTGILIYGKWV